MWCATRLRKVWFGNKKHSQWPLKAATPILKMGSPLSAILLPPFWRRLESPWILTKDCTHSYLILNHLNILTDLQAFVRAPLNCKERWLQYQKMRKVRTLWHQFQAFSKIINSHKWWQMAFHNYFSLGQCMRKLKFVSHEAYHYLLMYASTLQAKKRVCFYVWTEYRVGRKNTFSEALT